MTPDDLRALADALEPMAKAPRFEDFDVPGFCAWVRACADAKPVAWMYEHDGCVDTPLFTVNRWTKCEEPWNESPLFLHTAPTAPAGWKLVPVDPTPEMLASTSWPGCAGTDYAHMLAAAPAAPQAEPSAALIRAYNSGYMQGHHDTVEAQFIVIHPLDMDTYHADVVAELGLSAAPQAEPIDPHMIVADDRFPDEQAEPRREDRSHWTPKQRGEWMRAYRQATGTGAGDAMRAFNAGESMPGSAHGIGGGDAE